MNLSKMSFYLLLLMSHLIFIEVSAQTIRKINKKTKYLLGELVVIPSGKITLGSGTDFGRLKTVNQLIQGHEDFEKYQNAQKITPTVANLKAFRIMSTEVTNAQWKMFYDAMCVELGTQEAKIYLPDTTVWNKDIPNHLNDPLVEHYFAHPAFENHPVIGVSWEQTQKFCEWLTKEVNALQAQKGLEKLPSFRLPTEAEWEHAASQGQRIGNRQLLATSNGKFRSDKGVYLSNFGAVYDKSDTKIIDYSDDGTAYTNAVKFYAPNSVGLYDMSGNVAEWVSDDYSEAGTHKVCKGGAWITSLAYLFYGSRLGIAKEAQHSFVGFRVVLPSE